MTVGPVMAAWAGGHGGHCRLKKGSGGTNDAV